MSTTTIQNPPQATDWARIAADAQHVEDFVNGPSATLTTPGGTTRDSLQKIADTARTNYASINLRGAWATGTAYAVRDVYTSGGLAYIVLIAHTSSTVAADLAAGKVGVYQGALKSDVQKVIDDILEVTPYSQGATADGVAVDTSYVASAVSAAAAVGGTVLINRPYKIASNITMTSVRFAAGGKIILSAGAVLTISGPINAPAGQQIFVVSDATSSAVETTMYGSVALGQPIAKPEWFGDVFNAVLYAINALPSSGGTVELLDNRRYRPNATNFDGAYVSKANLRIKGARMPQYSTNCDRLANGSVIEGRFNVWADNFSHADVGYDNGKFVHDTYFPTAVTTTATYPLAGGTGTWDGFAFAQPNEGSPLAARRGYFAQNIRGLGVNSSALGHAVLQEGAIDGFVDNVVGMFCTHAHVMKLQKMQIGRVAGYGGGTDNFIIKSDSYAAANDLEIDAIAVAKQPPGTTPHTTPAQATSAFYLNCATANMSGIKIGKLSIRDATTAFLANGGNNLDNVQIGELEIDGYGTSGATVGMNIGSCNPYRIRVCIATISNVYDAVAYDSSTNGFASDPLVFDSLSLTNISLRGIQALNYGRVVCHHLRADTVAGLYAIGNNARVHVGREEVFSVTTKFTLSAPTLSSSWQQYAGNSAYSIDLWGYGVRTSGLLQPVSGGSGHVVTLPPYLKPSLAKRFPVMAEGTGPVDKALLATVGGSSNYLDINNGASAAGAEVYLSLDGLAWAID